MGAFWGSAPDDVWATNDGIGPPLWHWNGSAWSQQSINGLPAGEHWVYAIWGIAGDGVWAAGGNAGTAEIWHFDGAFWTLSPFTLQDTFTEIWGDCPSDVWARTTNGGQLWRNDGTGWTDTGERQGARMTGNGAAEIWMLASSAPDTLLHRQSNRCGDRVVFGGEICDPPHVGSDGLQCSDSCELLTCGNGQVDPGESCDPPTTWACDERCQALPAVCGDGVIQVGESCDMPDGVLCNGCRETSCGGCFRVHGGNTVCPALIGAQRRDCGRLLECMAPGLAACTFQSSLINCYCSDSACSKGADGPCAAEMQAVAQANDVAEVMRQINDASSLISAIGRDVQHLSGNACYQYCM